MKVSEIMSKPLTIGDEKSVRETAKIMSDKEVGSLIVVKDGRIAGIVTESDILKNIDKLNERVSKIMSKKVITIEHNESVDIAAELMSKNKIKKLPVTQNKKLAGIITATDIIAHHEDLNEEFFID